MCLGSTTCIVRELGYCKEQISTGKLFKSMCSYARPIYVRLFPWLLVCRSGSIQMKTTNCLYGSYTICLSDLACSDLYTA